LKKAIITICALLIFPAFIQAQEHRIGVGVGGASGAYTFSTTEIDLVGEMVELPVYLYVSKVGFMAGAKIMEFAVRGKLTSGVITTNVSYTQSLLSLTLGWNFQLADRLSIAPQIVNSYMGSSRVQFSSYQEDPFLGQFVIAADSYNQNASLSGYEIPIYYTGDIFVLGLKLCGYNSGADIEFPSTTKGRIDINGGIAFVMEANF
jgi:hypothetical protein